jgi:hypothetical protein
LQGLGVVVLWREVGWRVVVVVTYAVGG